ncbi:MAG: sulfatase family protein [Stackebrandtia sp.]
MERPLNVVLIHCHDLGRFLSCYGMEDVPSPNMDALADRSVVFDCAFSTSPLCTPARGSLFTGQSPHVNGLMGLSHAGWRYRRSVRTLPELLADHGYASALVGLQHEHPDSSVLGFGQVRGAGFLPRALPVADEADAWLREHGRQREPFLLTIGTWEVHRPWRAEDYQPVDPGQIQPPPFLPDNQHTRRDLAGFYGAIRQFDEAVGRMIDAVDAHTDPEHTALIVTTDHGAAFPRAKGTLYDPGCEVAFVVRPPASWDVPPGRRSQLVSHLDVAPTLLEWAAGSPPSSCEGRSLTPYLRDPGASDDRTLFLEKTYHDGYDPMRAVRTARYKYIRNFVDGPCLALSKDLEESETRRGMGDAHLSPRPSVELYDLADDPYEQQNIAERPEAAEIVGDLDARLREWMKSTRDPLVHGAIPSPPPHSRSVGAQSDLE